MNKIVGWLFNIDLSDSIAPPSYGAGTAPIVYIVAIILIGFGVLIGFLIWGL